jgi:hypothetical protein
MQSIRIGAPLWCVCVGYFRVLRRDFFPIYTYVYMIVIVTCSHGSFVARQKSRSLRASETDNDIAAPERAHLGAADSVDGHS